MQRQRGELVPIGEAFGVLGGPVKAIRDASPQTRRGFTVADQVHQLVSASEADPDRGFMARVMALCSLPRTNPGNRTQYKRVNGPFTLYMQSGVDTKLPFGNLPRLLMAWVSTEAVQTQSRVLCLGRSLSDFMRTLGVYDSSGLTQTRLRNQMKRLFGCTVTMIYEEPGGFARISSFVADKHEFWWNERKPDEPSLWQSKIELGREVFQRDHPAPRTARYEHPHGPQTVIAGPRSVPVADLPHLHSPRSAVPDLAASLPAVRREPGQGQR